MTLKNELILLANGIPSSTLFIRPRAAITPSVARVGFIRNQQRPGRLVEGTRLEPLSRRL